VAEYLEYVVLYYTVVSRKKAKKNRSTGDNDANSTYQQVSVVSNDVRMYDQLNDVTR